MVGEQSKLFRPCINRQRNTLLCIIKVNSPEENNIKRIQHVSSLKISKAADCCMGSRELFKSPRFHCPDLLFRNVCTRVPIFVFVFYLTFSPFCFFILCNFLTFFVSFPFLSITLFSDLSCHVLHIQAI